MKRQWWVAGLLAGAAALAIAAMVLGAGNAHPADEVRLLSGSAWLASGQVGQVTLLDGSSAEVAAQVKVAAPGDAIEVVQYGTTAYAVNRSTGTIRRVDGSTFEASQPEAPILDARGGLTAFAGKDVVHALDTDRGILASADGRTLATIGQPLSLAARLAAGGATVDSSGTLWVIDDASGDLTWVTNGVRKSRREASQPGHGLLTLVGDQPVLIDTGARTVVPVAPGTGAALGAVPIDLRPEDTVHVSGSPHDNRVYAVGSRGVLIVCDLSAGNCDHVVPLDPQSDLGTPVEVGHHVLVPDFRSGRVWIVDLTGDIVRSSDPLMSPPANFQLLTRDGVVFYNDPDSERAGVLRLDGTVRPASKYDPADPDKGLSSSTSTPTTAPTAVPPSEPATAPNEAPTEAPTKIPPTRTTAPTTTRPPPRATGQPPPTTTRTTPPTTTTTTSQPPAPPVLRVTLSKSTAEVGESITLQVSTASGEVPASAQWDFGDTTTGSGATVAHTWAAARTYQVSVQATMADGRQATPASASIQITAVPTYRLTLAVQGSGQAAAAGQTCPPTCTVDVPRGTNVSIAATAAQDFVFSGWSGGCSGTATPCQVTMNAPTTVTARFTDLAEPEDCIGYNPANLSVRQFAADDWRLIETRGTSEVYMVRFYNQTDANNGLSVARGYNQQCFVGRGTDMITKYWKGGAGQAGPVSPEDCLGYQASNLTIVEVNDSFGHWWSVRDGSHWMFSARTEPQAIRIKRVAQPWSQTCYIGRSSGLIGAETEYFR